jgi:hypothetical protein
MSQASLAVRWTLRDVTTHEPLVYRFCRRATIDSITDFLARYPLQCNPPDVEIRLWGLDVKPADTADTLGVAVPADGNEARVAGDVRVDRRGFQCLYEGRPVSERLVPPLSISFTLKLTVAELRRRLAGMMDTDDSLVQIFPPAATRERALTPVEDTKLAREFWQRSSNRSVQVLRFTGWARWCRPRMIFVPADGFLPLQTGNSSALPGRGAFGSICPAAGGGTGQRIAVETAQTR